MTVGGMLDKPEAVIRVLLVKPETISGPTGGIVTEGMLN